MHPLSIMVYRYPTDPVCPKGKNWGPDWYVEKILCVPIILYPLYTFITILTPMYTCYTCICTLTYL